MIITLSFILVKDKVIGRYVYLHLYLMFNAPNHEAYMIFVGQFLVFSIVALLYNSDGIDGYYYFTRQGFCCLNIISPPDFAKNGL